MEITPEIQERSEKIQAEIQNIVDKTYISMPMPGNAYSMRYQDCMNVAIFLKMAELELKLEKQQVKIELMDEDIYNLKP